MLVLLDLGLAADNFLRQLLLWFLYLLVYFLPSAVAQSRKHRNVGAIAMTNLLLGWTVIGWIIAFIWASTSNVHPANAVAAK